MNTSINATVNTSESDGLRHQDHTLLTARRFLGVVTKDSSDKRDQQVRLMQRIEAIQQTVRAVDLDLHTSLLISLIGGIKSAVGFNPGDIEAAVDVFELVLEDFKKKG